MEDNSIEQTDVDNNYGEEEFDSLYGMNEGLIDFLDLPVDIIYILFDQFDTVDFLSIRRVCRGWNATYWSIITSFDWRMFAQEKFDVQVLYSLAKRFGSLKRVDLSNCELIPTATIIDALSAVPGLTELSLAGTNVNSAQLVDALDQLPRISRLNLSFTSANDRVMAKICNLYGTRLRELRIDSCQVLLDTSPLSQLNQLEVLSLRQCRKITEAAVMHIKTMTNLRELRLTNNSNITSQVVSQVLVELKDLQTLELGFYDLTPPLIEAILNRKPLQSFIFHQLRKVPNATILRMLEKIRNYTHKGMTMDLKDLKELLEGLTRDMHSAHFEGMDGPREASFSIGPGTANELPVHLVCKSRSQEIKQLFVRTKKPFWKLTYTVHDDYGKEVDKLL